MTPAIAQMLKDHQVVWLDVSVNSLLERAKGNLDRPLLKNDPAIALARLASIRLPHYAEAATWRIDAEQSEEAIVAEVVNLVRGIRIIEVWTDAPYEVVIGRGILSRLARMLDGVSKTAIIHPPVMSHWAGIISAEVPGAVLIEVPEGEGAKTAEVLDRCWRTLASSGLTRSDAVIGLGGGATTDLAGFVAATYLRGIRFINVPTTVVGIADAAVGGKTGINLESGKNLVGSFYEPYGVLADLDMLKGLPIEEVRSGLAEIVKCGFIADPEILTLAEEDPSAACDTTTDTFAEVLTRAIQVKADVVSQDLREQDQIDVGRAALNYGHTLAHAIEKLEGFTWAHGNAVSVGMVYAAEVARRLDMIDEDLVSRHRRLLESLGLPISYASSGWDEVRKAMSLDKKARGSKLRFVLLDEVGSARVIGDIDENHLKQSYEAIDVHSRS